MSIRELRRRISALMAERAELEPFADFADAHARILRINELIAEINRDIAQVKEIGAKYTREVA